ncbi:hypothetical protein HJB89_11080 [Rhizobium sp. NZLR8]|uniref:hypothetical protein n=1 Tax=Rhizobium sp. NZLR8 TaxID=2731104 RepID=UPI001C83EB6D|nr:hypothetical protein [Rhizobium sp. NZLR8]MBX5157666.1 hypothetical protein [Rhizobium sp. NZLR8]
MLLILSAIDLLSSALICGFLLFVTLVGADTSNADTISDTDGSGDGIAVLELLSVSGNAKLKDHRTDNANVAPVESDIERRFFNAEHVSNKGFLIPNSVKSVTLADIDQNVVLRIYLPGKEPVELFLRCDPAGEPVLLILQPLTLPSSCRPGADSPQFSLVAGSTVLLPKDKVLSGFPIATPTPFGAANRFVLDKPEMLPADVTVWAVAL